MLAPGRLVSDPVDAISLGLALMLGTAGLPHILMRFYTVPDAQHRARTSVGYATAAIGFFYLLTFVLGFGAMVIVGRTAITAVDRGRQHGGTAAGCGASAAPAFLGFISAVAFATILAVVAGLALSGAATLSHDLWVNVVRRGEADPREELLVARVATVLLALVAIALGIALQGPERGLHGRVGVRHRGQRQLPGAGAVDLLEPADDGGRAARARSSARGRRSC